MSQYWVTTGTIPDGKLNVDIIDNGLFNHTISPRYSGIDSWSVNFDTPVPEKLQGRYEGRTAVNVNATPYTSGNGHYLHGCGLYSEDDEGSGEFCLPMKFRMGFDGTLDLQMDGIKWDSKTEPSFRKTLKMSLIDHNTWKWDDGDAVLKFRAIDPNSDAAKYNLASGTALLTFGGEKPAELLFRMNVHFL